MTKIMHLIAGAAQGGAEQFFLRLAPALARRGYQQMAVTKAHQHWGNALTPTTIDWRQLRFGGPLDLITPWQIRRLARQFKPDIILAWMNRAASNMPAGPWHRLARLGGYYDLKYYRHCQHLIGNTPDICRYLAAEGWPEAKIHYLPNFVALADEGTANRADWDTPADAPLLLCLGRLHPNKGFDVAIKAMRHLPGHYLWIAGAGPEEANLRALAASCLVEARIRFLGWRNDVGALLRASDIFLSASRHEPLGNMVLEAWSQHRPVVAAAAQGPSQLITDGKTGLLCPIDDDQAMARAILQLAAAPTLAQHLAEAAYALYANHYTEEAVVNQYQAFFDKLMGTAPTTGTMG